MSDQQPRQPKGAPGAGEFAAKPQGGEAGFSLSVTPSLAPLRDGLFDLEHIPVDLTDAELEALTNPDAPLRLRALTAATPYAGVAKRAAMDPHPAVRAIAAAGWQLGADEIAELTREPEVGRALEVLVGSGALGASPAAPEFSH